MFSALQDNARLVCFIDQDKGELFNLHGDGYRRYHQDASDNIIAAQVSIVLRSLNYDDNPLTAGSENNREQESAVAMLGLPHSGDITRAQLRIKESKEFKGLDVWGPPCFFGDAFGAKSTNSRLILTVTQSSHASEA
ncbi:hypothetical protein EVAR_10708_1 [Eumeta japonica]|uniref:Uncharacterized protein n=1 Tax=Eumeta variegata TaxID=151549 RepID=A0A4C1U7D9_EUMVA|nr:hypothetical protein EVAR_10708_1 [Eumeta japonica]